MSSYLEDKGYSDNGKTVVNCKKCGIPLFTFWNVKDSMNYTRVFANCPICGGNSGNVDFFGVNYIAFGNDGISEHFCGYDVEQKSLDTMEVILERIWTWFM